MNDKAVQPTLRLMRSGWTSSPSIGVSPPVGDVDLLAPAEPTDIHRLWATEGPGLRRLAYLLTNDASAADDIAADAICALLAQTVAIKRPEAWLRTVVVNNCRGVHRKRATRRKKAHLVSVAETISGPSADHVDLMRALDSLGTGQRQAVVLRYLFDLPVAEVAAICGTSVSTVASRIRRALIQLKGDLHESSN